jgi:HAD superfamily hydrolase (TIGR01509 family)
MGRDRRSFAALRITWGENFLLCCQNSYPPENYIPFFYMEMEYQHQMIKALIFDFDGLILETEMPQFQAWQEVYSHYGITLTLTTWLPLLGTGRSSQPFHPHDHLEAQLGQALDREEIRIRQKQRYAELLETQVLLPGVEALVAEAKQRRLQLAVASSSSRQWVTGHLARYGLEAHFDYIACGDEVPRTKPFPDVYCAALKKLGISGHQAIAFEDSLNGVQAAKRAGIYCVAVPNPLMQHLVYDLADLQFASLADISLEDLLTYFSDES